MSDELNSDEDPYANESFENDTDEIPEISETDSESEIEPEMVPSNSSLYAYARSRFSGRKGSLQNKNYMPYDSSSEDDQDVVISETIAEINTEPMCMDDAIKTPKISFKAALTRRSSSARMIGNKRMLVEPLSIVEIPNTAPTVSDDVSNGEISDNVDEDATAEVITENETEVLHKLKELSCIQDESSQEEDDVLLACNTPQPHEAPPDHGSHKEIDVHINSFDISSGEKLGENMNNFADIASVTDGPPKENDNELVEYEPSIDVHITSETPTSFNSEEYAFHLNFLKTCGSSDKLRMRSNPRKSWSFSNDRMREIERHNHILLRKILSQKPTYHLATPKPTKFATLPPTTRITSAAINRKKKQRQIDLDNQGLKRRIEAITLRRPTLQHLN
ncbi:protein hemingway isoform X1 [Bactrocera tryoni]|uniref:protein hemingway isoform X1 n=1 Tax=Bactrocera tryoni TaxID=59916 RepID=UPI001A976937|nr:protein hemingway isoform X1 [Bactrocera tryoni]XP_039947770.1 protein hemingway isoform X1 [Bactrocera tryoni]XP_039947771.1 protein hemingway isoform X1 [Bactrocera tryoni]